MFKVVFTIWLLYPLNSQIVYTESGVQP